MATRELPAVVVLGRELEIALRRRWEYTAFLFSAGPKSKKGENPFFAIASEIVSAARKTISSEEKSSSS